MDIEQVYREVNSQLNKDTFDNRIILTLTEWNCLKLRIKALETANMLLHDENQECKNALKEISELDLYRITSIAMARSIAIEHLED